MYVVRISVLLQFVEVSSFFITLTLQGGHLKITAVGPLAVVFFNYPFKFCSKLYYA
jgi:hypothetical protein